MSRPPDILLDLSETLSLCEYKTGGYKGFWLYDKTRGMNLAMRAETSTDAFVAALEYYQKRLTSVEREHKDLKEKVDVFVDQFIDEGAVDE